MTDLQKEQIGTLRLQGIGYLKIAQILGISSGTVRSFCCREGLAGKIGADAVKCKQCGKLIKGTPKRKPRKFCSDSCRTTWWNAHPECVNRKAIYHFTCADCGKAFTAYGNQHRKYCSHVCYIASRYGKQDCHE